MYSRGPPGDAAPVTDGAQEALLLGVPYDNVSVLEGESDAQAQALEIANQLREEVELDGPPAGESVALEDSELVALIAYLQRLGQNQSDWQPSQAEATASADTEAAQ